jgi:hypothetical protein
MKKAGEGMIIQTRNAVPRWILVIAFFVVAMFGVAPRASAQALTNADVVKMVQAKLSDATIISEIKNSTCTFDTSPDALIKLKQAGVSDQVLQAMTETRHQGKEQASGIHSSSPLPTAYGFYVVDGQELRELELVNVTTRIGLIAGATIGGSAGYAVDGLAGDPPIVIHDLTPTILVYQQSFEMSTLHLSKLAYVSTMQAYQFNMLGTQPAFFRNVYGRGYYDTVQIDLWRPDEQVPIRIEPVEGRSGMYRLIPATALQPGRYSLYETGSVHGANIIFASLQGRSSQAFYFGVESSGSSPTHPSTIAPTPIPIATASCSDYTACLSAGDTALKEGNWSQAFANFRRSSTMDTTKPEAWAGQGMVDLPLGQGAALVSAWDNALARGGTLTLGVWHYAGFHIPQGVFRLDSKTVTFIDSKGKTVFSVSPLQVSALQSHHPPPGGRSMVFWHEGAGTPVLVFLCSAWSPMQESDYMQQPCRICPGRSCIQLCRPNYPETRFGNVEGFATSTTFPTICRSANRFGRGYGFVRTNFLSNSGNTRPPVSGLETRRNFR